MTKFNKEFNTSCSEELAISPKNGFIQQAFLHFVRDAVYAFAYALNDMHLERCGGEPGLCDAMRHIDGPELIKYIGNVTFKGKLTGNLIQKG